MMRPTPTVLLAVTVVCATALTTSPAAAHVSPARTPAASPASPAAPASTSCDYNSTAYGPIGGGWSRAYTSVCSYIVDSDTPERVVSWEITDFSSAEACVEARGYRWRDGKAYWTSLGCGASGHGTVHWGEAGGPHPYSPDSVKVKSLNIVLGAPIYFG